MTKKIAKKSQVAATKKQKKSTLPRPLSEKKVFAPCPTSIFEFKSTKDVEICNEIIAQERATRAISVGLGIRRPGYNIYVAGYRGTGKSSVIKDYLERCSTNRPTPCDWVYVHDFKVRETPKAIALAAGQGKRLVETMEKTIETLQSEIPIALQSEDYETTVNRRISKNNETQARQFTKLEKIAKKMGFLVKSSRMGIETIPVVDGRILSEKEYSRLGEKDRNQVESRRCKLEPLVLQFARNSRKLEIETKEYLKTLQKELVSKVLTKTIQPAIKQFEGYQAVKDYLIDVVDDIILHVDEFVDDDFTEDDDIPLQSQAIESARDRFRRYRVNLFVDNSERQGAPIIIDTNPSYYNLFGKVEKNVEHGMFSSDFTMIKAGSIHKANGGYLVVDASDILKLPSVWETLKRVLKSRVGFIEDMGEQVSMFPTSGIRPEPIALDVKVIMLGTDDIYHFLYEVDDEFSKLFKIKSDFDYKMPRNAETIAAYVSFIATRCHREGLLHFDPSGIAAVVEHGSRLVEDQRQLTSQFGEIKDLTIEADFVARERKSRIVRRIHVEEAIRQKSLRVNLMEQHMHESIKCHDILISVDGVGIGQVNGLAVYEMGDYAFGKPGRITCTVSVGEEGVVNVERSSKLSGNIHDKGVSILTGILHTLLAKKQTLGITASLCFEQSYSLVDGDSATAAELICILSAMAEIPVSLGFAITGSLSQLGEIQAVGGINEKIEGFYKACQIIGKNDVYSVIIPNQNVSNLMLSEPTRGAVAQKKLNILPVRYFWEAFELMTSVSLGVKSIHDQDFVAGSALDIVRKKLQVLNNEYEQPQVKLPTAAKKEPPTQSKAALTHRQSRLQTNSTNLN